MVLPNWRNAAGTNGPPLFTSPDGTYQNGVLIRNDWGLTVFKRSLTTGAITSTFDLSSVPALVTYGITPIVSDALGGDDHNHISIAIDDQNRTWIGGNSRGILQIHLIVSAPNSISSWTTIAQPFPWVSSTSPWGNYFRWLRLSDGRLLQFYNRRDDSAHDQGLEIHGFILPLGGSTTSWSPLVGTGLMMDTNFGSVPERIYLFGGAVEGPYHPHPDRVWLAGVWRDAWADGASQHDPFIIYNDTVTNSATWKRIDGTSQTMPCTYANTQGTGYSIPIFGQAYWFPSWTLNIDRQGHPHMMNFTAVDPQMHVWWDGSTWQNETFASSVARPSLHILPNGQIVKHYPSASNGTVVVTKFDGTNLFRFGGSIPIGNWAESFADPIQQAKGNLHLVIPDGDTPQVFTFGDHARRVAS